MFSVIFPGQGSQSVGMVKNFYNKFDYVKDLFSQADDLLNFPLSNKILYGPKEELDLTENTQPAIFLASYSIYLTIKKEINFNFNETKYFAGHSLGEYSALVASGSLEFEDAIKLLKIRGKAMQSAVPKGEGGMLAVLGSNIDIISNLILENKNNYQCYIANDNSTGQVVISGKNKDLDLLIDDLNKKSIKNIRLSVSAPFHCKLMQPATKLMQNEILNTKFKIPESKLISNVTAQETNDPNEIKDLLIKQIESPVKWRESIIFMAKNGVKKIIEIGPGKVLSGLIKRIDRSLKTISVNDLDDFKNLKIND